MTIKQALIEVFGTERAVEIFEESYDLELTYLFGKPTLSIIKFDKTLKTPDDLSLKQHLENLCGSNETAYKTICNYLGVGGE